MGEHTPLPGPWHPKYEESTKVVDKDERQVAFVTYVNLAGPTGARRKKSAPTPD